jgi:hypothetical protein
MAIKEAMVTPAFMYTPHNKDKKQIKIFYVTGLADQ